MKTNILYPVLALAAGMAVLPARAQTGPSSDTIFFNGVPTVLVEGQPETWVFLGPAPNAPDGAVYLTEPGVPTQISDAVIAQSGLLYFGSDDEKGNLPVPLPAGVLSVVPIASFPETGNLQDLSQYFNLPPGALLVQSDVEVVPEPSTLAMMGLGFGGLMMALRRRGVA